MEAYITCFVLRSHGFACHLVGSDGYAREATPSSASFVRPPSAFTGFWHQPFYIIGELLEIAKCSVLVLKKTLQSGMIHANNAELYGGIYGCAREVKPHTILNKLGAQHTDMKAVWHRVCFQDDSGLTINRSLKSLCVENRSKRY